MADPLRGRSETYRIMSRGESPEEAIRRLVQTASGIAEPRPVSMWEWASGRPSFLTSRPKSQERRLADTRRQFVMDEMLHKYPKPTAERPGSWDGIPGEFQRAMTMYASDASPRQQGPVADWWTGARGNRTDLQSPYETTGQLGPGSKIRSLMDWSQSLPAAFYATREMASDEVANARAKNGTAAEVQYPEAASQFDRAMGTLVEPLVGRRPGSMWDVKDRARQAGDRLSLQGTEPAGYFGPAGLPHEMLASHEGEAGAPRTGEEVMQAAGYSPTASRWAGALMDSTLDPFSAIVPAARLAKAGQMGRAVRALASDYGPNMALTGAISAGEAAMDEGDNVVSWDEYGDPYKVTREDRVLRRLQGR